MTASATTIGLCSIYILPRGSTHTNCGGCGRFEHCSYTTAHNGRYGSIVCDACVKFASQWFGAVVRVTETYYDVTTQGRALTSHEVTCK